MGSGEKRYPSEFGIPTNKLIVKLFGGWVVVKMRKGQIRGVGVRHGYGEHPVATIGVNRCNNT